MIPQHEILEAAKEAGLVSSDYQHDETDNEAWRDLSRFSAIIERKTIERCAVVCEMLRDLQMYADKQEAQNDCATAIRKLGDE